MHLVQESGFGPVGDDFKVVRFHFGPLELGFWPPNLGSDSRFQASGSQFYVSESRPWALGVISPRGVDFRPSGLNFTILVSGSRFWASVSQCWTLGVAFGPL